MKITFNSHLRIKAAFVLALFSALLLSACKETPASAADRERATAVKSETRYGDGFLYTVEHDGHMFVIEGRYSKGAMLHHPDCKCGKR